MNGWKKYRSSRSVAVDPTKAIVMAYEKAINELGRLEELKRHLNHKEIEEVIEKVEKIIHLLNMDLNRDFDKNDELRQMVLNLESIHEWSLRKLKEIRLTKNVEEVENIKDALNEIAEGYRGAVK